jgi:hypothetical protein
MSQQFSGNLRIGDLVGVLPERAGLHSDETIGGFASDPHCILVTSQRALLRVSSRVRREDLRVEISAELAIQSRQQVGERRAVGVLR